MEDWSRRDLMTRTPLNAFITFLIWEMDGTSSSPLELIPIYTFIRLSQHKPYSLDVYSTIKNFFTRMGCSKEKR